MKHVIPVALLFVFSLISCNNDARTEESDTPLYDCMCKKAFRSGIDAEKELDTFEETLIEYGILENSSGQAKIDFYNNIIQRGDYPKIPLEVMMNENISELKSIIQFSPCSKLRTKDDPESAKIFEAREALEKMQGDAYNASPVHFASAALSVFNAKDLEEPFYRAYFLISINSVLDRILAPQTYLYEKDSVLNLILENIDAYAQDAFIIDLDDKEQLTLEGKPCKLNSLAQKAKPYIKQQLPTNTKFFQVQVPESMDPIWYDRIIAEIQLGITELLSEIAQEDYGKAYDQLTIEEIEEINNRHPVRIIKTQTFYTDDSEIDS